MTQLPITAEKNGRIQTKVEKVEGIGDDLFIQSLLNAQQFYDPYRIAELAGIPPAAWAFFGLIWPSARVLAEHMRRTTLHGQKILEIGCGLGLASLVLKRRGENITASDCHPNVLEFLKRNLALNHLPELPYLIGNYQRDNPLLGRFDIMIASDILYETGQALPLASFMNTHLEDRGQVILVDPNRQERPEFSRQMESFGFELISREVHCLPGLIDKYHGKLLIYQRN